MLKFHLNGKTLLGLTEEFGFSGENFNLPTTRGTSY